jgi:hypothetical protein
LYRSGIGAVEIERIPSIALGALVQPPAWECRPWTESGSDVSRSSYSDTIALTTQPVRLRLDFLLPAGDDGEGRPEVIGLRDGTTTQVCHVIMIGV